VLDFIRNMVEDDLVVVVVDHIDIVVEVCANSFVSLFIMTKAIDLLDEAGAIAHLNSSEDDEEPPTVDEHTVADVISDWARFHWAS
jgi:hypothetical protein